MPSIVSRMRKLRSQLLNIRFGPGAAVLPKDVQRIHLSFAQYINGGHRGPRKFWRLYYQRLKYHNPALITTVDRDGVPQDGPATLTIFYAGGETSASASSATTTAATSDPTSTAAAATHSTTTPSSPAGTTIPTSSLTPSTPPSPYTPTSHVLTIDCKHKQPQDILSEFLALTKAQPVIPSASEQEQLDEMKRLEEASVRDREIQARETESRVIERERMC
ncbi:hypothetical protein K402DRAFT_123339 [Aulographum hederae CBS 113979]|uniref:Uncharacterized protein n=1 Tax=Aulographum hederae CBS 113979 TaxID=1176131 RepID=A0A6G1HE62_9PEZI|nr:hypothetical protein K402DRAFT_123339 [Aulographum hederae CBS 113979]